MFKYVLKRLLYFIPTLFIISLFTFMLSKWAPGDPVDLRLKGGMSASSSGLSAKLAGEQAYNDMSDKMGLNLPVFYFTITSKAFPDTLYRIRRLNERQTLTRLIEDYGDWPQVSEYYHSLKALELSLDKVPSDSNTYTSKRLVYESINFLYIKYDSIIMKHLVDTIASAVNARVTVHTDSVTTTVLHPMAALQPGTNRMVDAFNNMRTHKNTDLKYIPAIHWYGTRNQYHRWLFGDVPWFGKNTDPTKHAKGFFRLDFGESYQDGRPVSSILKDAIVWTLLINVISVLLSYIISIPIGIESAVKKDSLFDRVTTTVLFIFYSLPSFWIATLLIVFFTTSEYGMNWFPTYGVATEGLEHATFFTRFWDISYHMILPVFCVTYASFAFISRQMRGAMVAVIKQDYIRTANAKGLEKVKVVWKHAFRNSLIPIITMFANLFPLMISGSVIIEYIFNIPGMGRISYESEVARNYPVMFTILMFSAILTMVGTLVSDLLYAVVDPRISYSKKS